LGKDLTFAYSIATASKQQLRFNLRLIVQNNVQQGTVDLNVAVVINEAQLPKFVHEKAHTRSRRAAPVQVPARIS
jgi:hypothetical protein